MKLKHVLISILIAASQLACADEKPKQAGAAALKQKVEKAYPKLTVHSVEKTPYADLYEIFLGNQILYSDKNFSFFIVEGQVVDPTTKTNLTASRLDELMKVDFASLPLDKAIKVVKGNGKRKVVVFSDVDCPFCKRLERNELSQVTDVTIYTFLYPIDSLHPNAAAKSKLIWCAEDRVAAWNDWILRDKLPKASGDCKVPLEEVGALARKIGVDSTPVLIFSDGLRMKGMRPHKQIEAALQAAEKR